MRTKGSTKVCSAELLSIFKSVALTLVCAIPSQDMDAKLHGVLISAVLKITKTSKEI